MRSIATLVSNEIDYVAIHRQITYLRNDSVHKNIYIIFDNVILSKFTPLLVT